MCDKREYLISASLIASGILTLVQVLRIKLCRYSSTPMISDRSSARFHTMISAMPQYDVSPLQP